jgi:lipid-binding SYLF domain-containing protein
MTNARRALVLALSWIAMAIPWPALVAEAQTLDEEVESALRELVGTTPAARNLLPTARGILVFPNIFRENYAFGVQSGYGALIMGGKIVGYFSTTSIAYGLQAGVLPFGYALFLMTEAALSRLGQPDGWNVGRDPGVAILPTGTPQKPDNMDTQGGTMDATGGTLTRRPTARTDTYAFILGDTGLMTGVGMEGWRIVRVTP